MNKKILGIGNAIVDVFAQVEENFLKETKNYLMMFINSNEYLIKK